MIWENDYCILDYGINNGVECIYGMVELFDGSFLICGMVNKLFFIVYVVNIVVNGDFFWVCYYDVFYCGFVWCVNLYYNNVGELYGVFELFYGKMVFVKLNLVNGDMFLKFNVFFGDVSGWYYYEYVELFNGDYVMVYIQGNGMVGFINCFILGVIIF